MKEPRHYDAATIEGCRRGDRDALERVLGQESPILELTLRRIIGPHRDLEDLVQSTFVAAIEAFPRYRGEAAVGTWIASIGIRLCYEALRAPARRKRAHLEIVHGASEEDPAPAPDRVVASREALGRVYLHLETLSAKKRVAFVLHRIEGRPIKEVAALMNASVTATKSRLMFARRELWRHVEADSALADLLRKAPSR